MGMVAVWTIATDAAFGRPAFAQEESNEDKRWRDIEKSIDKLEQKFKLERREYAVVINPEKQELHLVKNRKIVKTYPVSTAKRGLGCQKDSEKTPYGTHRVKEKFGDGAEAGTIFRQTKNTGCVAEIYTEKVDICEDNVTTRIMWLDGQEKGVNRGGRVDSHERAIYIHGTPEEGFIGEPASHGCVRMKNQDVIELYNLVTGGKLGTLVEIQNRDYQRQE